MMFQMFLHYRLTRSYRAQELPLGDLYAKVRRVQPRSLWCPCWSTLAETVDRMDTWTFCIAASFCITQNGIILFSSFSPFRNAALLPVFVSVSLDFWLSGELRIQRRLLQGGEKPDVRAHWRQTGSYHLGQRPHIVCVLLIKICVVSVVLRFSTYAHAMRHTALPCTTFFDLLCRHVAATLSLLLHAFFALRSNLFESRERSDHWTLIQWLHSSKRVYVGFYTIVTLIFALSTMKLAWHKLMN